MVAVVHERGAAVIPVPPPAFYGAGFAAGLVVNNWAPFGFGRPAAVVAIAVCLVAAGQALALAGVATVVRHRTTIVPHRAVSTLVTTGPYRVSRNPMYTGLVLAYLGVALLVGTWWPLIALPVVLILVLRLVIRPEEQYLAGQYGAAYTEYQRRVRRWL